MRLLALHPSALMYTRVYPVEDLLMEIPDFNDAPDFSLNSTSTNSQQGGRGSRLAYWNSRMNTRSWPMQNRLSCLRCGDRRLTLRPRY